MKRVLSALVLLGVASPALANTPLPRPDDVRWICGQAATINITGAGPNSQMAEFALVSPGPTRWDFLIRDDVRDGPFAAMTGAVTRAIGTKERIAVGYVKLHGA